MRSTIGSRQDLRIQMSKEMRGKLVKRHTSKRQARSSNGQETGDDHDKEESQREGRCTAESQVYEDG